MASIVDKIRSSSSELLKAEGADMAKWSKLRHTKADLELFLNYNIAEITFTASDKTEHRMICTSNTTLIKLFSLAKENERAKVSSISSSGIRTKDLKSVDTWDLEANKRKTIKLDRWQIINFVSITPDNILIVDEIVRKLLKA